MTSTRETDPLTHADCGPTACERCGHWIGGPDASPPYECRTCGAFVPEVRGGRA